jgi:hypothetical protein
MLQFNEEIWKYTKMITNVTGNLFVRERSLEYQERLLFVFQIANDSQEL